MRKRLKRKKRSCDLCKPHKTGHDNRWKTKHEAALRRFKRQRAREMNHRDPWNPARDADW